MIYGDPITLGGGGSGTTPTVLAYYIGQIAKPTAGSAPTSRLLGYDENYFSQSANTFTCQKPGAYIIRLGARSAYGSNGGSRYTCAVNCAVNGVIGTRTVTSTESSSAPTSKFFSVSLSKGDVLTITANNSSGNVLVDLYVFIVDHRNT